MEHEVHFLLIYYFETSLTQILQQHEVQFLVELQVYSNKTSARQMI